MIYLEKVILVIESHKYNDKLDVLCKTLKKSGINVEKAPMKQYFDIPKNAPAEEIEKELWENRKMAATKYLYFTDNAEWADICIQEGYPVLALLHEDNRQQDFSSVKYACEQPEDLDADYMDKVYRRYAELPWDILETDRCIIRETTEADVEPFFEIYGEPSITRYTEGLYPEVEQEKQYIRDYIENVYGFYGFGVWTIVQKDTGKIIGRAGLSYRDGYEEPEIGFVIGVPWQRQGYAFEVCHAIMEYGREELGFDCVQAFVIRENKASVKLCEKLGLHKNGTAKIGNIIYERYIQH